MSQKQTEQDQRAWRRMVRNTHWYGRELQLRGWTPAAIRRFLGEPDASFTLPGCQGEAHFYRRERVEAVEGSPEYQAFQVVTARRRAGARKGLATRQQNEAAAQNRDYILAHRRAQGYRL